MPVLCFCVIMLRLPVIILCYLCIFISVVFADDCVSTEGSEVCLKFAGWRGEKVEFGVQFSIKSGWKMYSNETQEIGIPAIIDFSVSDIPITNMLIRWPISEKDIQKIGNITIESFVYNDDVVVPVEFELNASGSKVTVSADVNYAVCKDVCIPVHVVLRDSIKRGKEYKNNKALVERWKAK